MILLSYRMTLLTLEQCRQHLKPIEWQYAQNLSAKRKLQFSNGRALTRQLLNKRYRYRLADIDIELPTDKAPSLTVNGQEWHLSISHSAQAVAVAVSETDTVGLDIEKIKPRNITEFTAEYVALANAEKLTDFYQSWTAAEAYSKYSREPLFNVLKQSLTKEITFKHLLLSDYMLCLCSKKNVVEYILFEDKL